MKKSNTSAIQILSNTAGIQAVYHQPLDMFQAVFYQPGSVTFGSFELRVDKACILLIKNVSGGQVISIADPLQKEQTTSLVIKDLRTGKSVSHTVDLPQNELAGSTVEIK